MSAKDISTARKRRGVAKASITRLAGRLKELESRPSEPNTATLAQQMLKNIESLNSDFKAQHLALIDLLEDGEALEKEQEALDEHDEAVTTLIVRIHALVSSLSTGTDPDPRKVVSRRLLRLRKTLSSVATEIGKIASDPVDACLVRQREEQLRELKQELGDISRTLLSLDLREEDELMALHTTLEGELFDQSLKLKRMLAELEKATPSTASDGKGIKLPRIDVPKFNGSIIQWSTFWEQFSVSVHSRSDLADSEKLVYLRQSVKDGSARQVIEGLSRSGNQYTEAIECLKARFDRPRLIHQVHVKKIMEASPLKEGNGRELRHLHDIIQQHVRALKTMGHEPSGSFITAVLELKLDKQTLFEWHKHSHESTDVPHYKELLEFINSRAQASETSVSESGKLMGGKSSKPLSPFAASVAVHGADLCIHCKTGRHPLYSCCKFKALTHDGMIAVVKANKLCINCLRPGHFVKECKSLHRCRTCQKPHHSLLHSDLASEHAGATPATDQSRQPPLPPHDSSNAATGLAPNALLMTCQVLVTSPQGYSTKARALLDPGSTVSFISDRLAKSLRLSRSQRSAKISGVACLSRGFSSHSISSFQVSPRNSVSKRFDVSAIIVPQVTCDLPTHPVSWDPSWDYLRGLQLADPTFGRPRAIDLLLGVDLFAEVLLHGRRVGPPSSPMALETAFGWVLAGAAEQRSQVSHMVVNHATLLSGDELLQRFWETEEPPKEGPVMSSEEMAVVKHFQSNHYRTIEGRFVIPLPRKPDAGQLGESRVQAVRRFLSMERSLHLRKQFSEFADVVEEYFSLGHAEEVPTADTHKPPTEVFYLPMHAVRKAASTTTKLRVVFDGSAKSSTGVSLNETLMVGPNVHSPLLDVLLRFRLYHVALTADVSKMYRAIELTEGDKDFHRFVWRSHPGEPLRDCRMTRVTFGISASSFAANMAMRQNAVDFAARYPSAAKVVDKSDYVDDCLTGADTVDEARNLQIELQALFGEAKFLLRKWNSSDPCALDHVPPLLRESPASQVISDRDSPQYTKTLGIEWDSSKDAFRLTISESPASDTLTKRLLVSDLAKTFDILGWLSPSIIKAKILLQRIWERKVGWDEIVPRDLLDVWRRWRSELHLLSDKHLS